MADGDGRFTRAGRDDAALVLDGSPLTFAPPSLPGHRMLSLTLRNAGDRPVEVRPREIDLIDDADEPLRATAGLGRDQAATTSAVTLAPGRSLPVDLVWRARPDAGIPTRVAVGDARIGLDGVPTSARPS